MHMQQVAMNELKVNQIRDETRVDDCRVTWSALRAQAIGWIV